MCVNVGEFFILQNKIDCRGGKFPANGNQNSGKRKTDNVYICNKCNGYEKRKTRTG